MKWLVICHKASEAEEATHTCTLDADTEEQASEMAVANGLVVDLCMPADAEDVPNHLAKTAELDPQIVGERLRSKSNETRKLDILYGLLTGVAEACAEALHSNDRILSGFPEGGAPDAADRARFELYIFGLYQVSHAMLYADHDRSAWGKAMSHCAARLNERFRNVAVEGNNFDGFIGIRVSQYGRWTETVRKSGRTQSDLVDGWMRMLRNNIASAWSGETLAAVPSTIVVADARYTAGANEPTLAVTGFTASSAFEVEVSLAYYHLLYQVLHRPMALLCGRAKNILTLDPETLERMLAECVREARAEADPQPKKKRTWWSRLFRR